MLEFTIALFVAAKTKVFNHTMASYIQNMLLKMATEEVHMLLGVSGEIDSMGIKLRDLKNFLAGAERRNITDQSVQAWVRDPRPVPAQGHGRSSKA
jgi:hypothetical protein